MVCWIENMSSKVNVSSIITDHLKTLRDEATDRISKLDILTFFGLGTAAAAVVMWQKLLLSDNAIGVMVAAFSIFAGLLINVLVLIYTVAQRTGESTRE